MFDFGDTAVRACVSYSCVRQSPGRGEWVGEWKRSQGRSFHIMHRSNSFDCHFPEFIRVSCRCNIENNTKTKDYNTSSTYHNT